MTLWPDQPAKEGQPPQTRRQARESERSAARQAARRAGTAEPTPAGEIPAVTTPYASTAQAAERADDRPSLPATAFAEPGVTPPSRPNLPGYGGSFDSLVFSGAGESASSAEEAPESASEASEATDAEPSAPEAPAANRGATLFRDAADPSQPEPITTPVGVISPVAASVPTPSAPSAPPAAAAVPTPSAAAAPDQAAAPSDRPLTRRELRAMLQAQEANQKVNHQPAAGEPVIPVTFTPPAEPEPAAPAPSASAPTPEVSSTTKSAWPFAPLTPAAAEAPATQAEPEAAQPAPAAPAAPAASDEDASSEERRPFTPPTGHWSVAAEQDATEEKEQPILSRNVGQSTAATATNALILPSLPQADATGPLTSTGEILVTGSIDLPRGLGATGAHPDHIDSSDIDRLLDGEENEFNTSEVAPVRASRAISSHTSTRGVITPPKKRGNTLPVVLMVTAGVLAVGVIGLLVAAYVLKVF